MYVYKFVDWDVAPARTDITYETFIQNYNKHRSCVWETLRTGCLKLGGWCYDFREDLRKFVFKDYYGNWHEVYAPNKTAIRNSVYGRILKIIEI